MTVRARVVWAAAAVLAVLAWPSVALAGTPVFLRMGASQCSDVPLGFFFLGDRFRRLRWGGKILGRLHYHDGRIRRRRGAPQQ